MKQELLHDFLVDKIDDMKAQNIITLNVTGKSSLTDYLIVCTGTSKRHVNSVADHLTKEAQKHNIQLLGVNNDDSGEWVVVDMGSTMIHIMQAPTRELYQLEKLWG